MRPTSLLVMDLASLSVCGAGCGDACIGWGESAIDPRIRRSAGWVQIGAGAIFSELRGVERAGEPLRAIAMSPAPGAAFTVVGEAGEIRRSTDGGDTWAAPASPPVAEDLFGVRHGCEEDSPYSIAVGDAGRILRSTTGGEVWVAADSPTTAPLRDVAMVVPDIVIAVGDGGTILRSPDRGVTWEAVPSGTQEDLRALALEDCAAQTQVSHPVRGLAVGDRGTVLVTRDGGTSWNRLQLGIEGDLLQVQVGTSSLDQWQIHGMFWRWSVPWGEGPDSAY